MRHLLSLLVAAAALPLMASCSATVAPDGYGYSDAAPAYYNTPSYYGNAYPQAYYSPYPRYREYRNYHPYAVRHERDDHRRVIVEQHHEEPEIHGHIAIER